MSSRAATGLLERRRSVMIARHRRRRTVLLTIVAGAAAMAGTWWLGTGPLLSVTSVQIAGYRQADQAELLRTVQIASHSGTMLKLPTVAVREALLRYPWVADVAVHHRWPRGIDVVITQARPAAIALTADGRRLAVATSGRVLGPATERVALPSYRVDSLRVGEWVTGPAARAPFEIVTAMSPATGRRVRDLHLTGGVIVGSIEGGPRLVFGPPRDLWAKGRSVEAVLTNPAIAKKLASAAYLDVSSPKQPMLGGVAEGGLVPSTQGQPLPTG